MSSLDISENSQAKSQDGSDDISSEIMPKPNKQTAYISLMKGRFRFLSLIILLTMNYTDLIPFSVFVSKFGGILFIIVYLIISIMLIIPIFLVEIGLAQFFSRTALTMFEIVPIFRGLGWSAFLVNVFFLIQHCHAVKGFLIYLIYTLFTDMPWKNCGEQYKVLKSIKCKVVFNLTDNASEIYITPGQLFFELEVQNTRSWIDGSIYTVKKGFGGISLTSFISIIFVWGLVLICVWLTLNFYMKVIYTHLVLISLILLILSMRTIHLPGSFTGIKQYLFPKFGDILSVDILKEAGSHCLYTAAVGSSIISGIAHLNEFSYNFYQTSYIIIFNDLIFSLICGIIQFSVLGFMAHQMGSNDIVSILDIYGLTFHTFTDGTSSMNEARFLNLLFSLLMLNIGVWFMAVSVASLIISLINYFPNFFHFSSSRTLSCTVAFCIFECLLSLIFCFRGSVVFLDNLTWELISITVPLVVLIEISIVHYIYGSTRFRSDLKMILGFSYNFMLTIVSKSIIQIYMIFILITSIISYNTPAVTNLLKSISFICTIICMLPLLTMACLEILRLYRLYDGLEILLNSIKTSEVLGPHYKYNWLLNRFYQKKLLNLRNNSEFLKTISENEDINKICYELTKILQDTKNQKKLGNEVSSN